LDALYDAARVNISILNTDSFYAAANRYKPFFSPEEYFTLSNRTPSHEMEVPSSALPVRVNLNGSVDLNTKLNLSREFVRSQGNGTLRCSLGI